MILELPRALRFIAQHFAGSRKFLAEQCISAAVTACRFENITYPFDRGVMDGKRLIALAAGVIEAEEIALARKYLTADDVLVEFGSGLGIAAARVHQAIHPKAIFCDIEGAENEFLPPEDLQNVDKVIIELHPSHYGMQGVQQIKERFAKHGFIAVEKRQDTYCFLRY